MDTNTTKGASLYLVYIFGFLILFLLGVVIYLFTNFSKTKEDYASKLGSCTQEVEKEVPVCTYARYGIEYTDEEEGLFKTSVYRRISVIEDGGYLELILRLNEGDKTFVLDTQNSTGEGVEIKGTYVEAEDVLTLTTDEEYDDLELPAALEFTITDSELGIIEYTGDSVTDGYPENGDKYYFYWME